VVSSAALHDHRKHRIRFKLKLRLPQPIRIIRIHSKRSPLWTGPNVNYTTIKYSPDCVTLWESVLNFPTGYQHASDLVVDEFGNTYVTGHIVYLKRCLIS